MFKDYEQSRIYEVCCVKNIESCKIVKLVEIVVAMSLAMRDVELKVNLPLPLCETLKTRHLLPLLK